MAILEENLRTFILADDTVKNLIGARLAYNHVPQQDQIPYGWFSQSGSTDDDGIGDAAGLPTRVQYDFEFWTENALTSKTLTNRVQQLLHKYRGTLGDQTVQAIFAASQTGDYVPRGVMDDQGFHGGFLSVEVVPA